MRRAFSTYLHTRSKKIFLLKFDPHITLWSKMKLVTQEANPQRDPPYQIPSSDPSWCYLSHIWPMAHLWKAPGWNDFGWTAALIWSPWLTAARRGGSAIYCDEVLQSKLIMLLKVRNVVRSVTTVTSLDGCIFDTFVCHTYQMALSKYAFGMLL